MHRTDQFRMPCPDALTHSILVTEKPQAMFAAFQILSFERSGIADQLHKKRLSPIRPEVTNVPKQKTYRPFYRRSPFERLCRVAGTKKLSSDNISPRFHSSAERARLRVTTCRPSFPPSDRRRPCELLIFACQPYDQLLSSNRSGQICPPRK